MAENAVLTVNLNMNGEDRQFRVFDNDLCKGVVKDILEGRTYPIFSFYQEAKVILDVGANIGAAAVYLHGFYTQARILCFEPGADALELLKFNTAHSDRISVHPFGLFNKDKSAKLFKGSRDSVTSSIQPGGETEHDSEVIELREAKTFLQSMDIRSIDILKLDSEGCEVQILSSLSSFIPEITIIYLEYHSDMTVVGSTTNYPLHTCWFMEK